MKKHTAKRQGLGLEMKTFLGKSGTTYLVFKSTKGSYHAMAEVEAKRAAIDCGGKEQYPDGMESPLGCQLATEETLTARRP